MNSIETIETARIVCGEVLSALKVGRVICVDDAYRSEPSLEEVLVTAIRLEPDMLKGVLPEIGDDVPGDEAVLAAKIRQIWSEMAEVVRSDRARKVLALARILGNDEIDDRGDASLLSEMIPGGMLLTLSPSQWEEQRDVLLEHNKEHRQLFLFDQDLSQDGGETVGGIKIISQLLGGEAAENLICGLLTHTVTPDDQQQRWEELSRDYSIERDRFLVVPKAYLSKDPIIFAQNLKFIALTPLFSDLKDKAVKILNDAAATAAERVNAVSIYDLNHMVFRLSDDEGIWEPDVLFRLHSLFQKLEARRLAHAGGELEAIASQLRAISLIPAVSKFQPHPTTWRIQREALYENADYINNNHLPLELGDIFAKDNSDASKKYVILVQPCDLMVRKNGKRAPDIVSVPLAEITSLSDESKKEPFYSEELKYYGVAPGDRWFARLKIIHYVRVAILDLCAFNTNGTAIIWSGEKVPESVRPAWKARYSILQDTIKTLVSGLSLLSSPQFQDPDVVRAKNDLEKRLLKEAPFKAELIGHDGRHGISYNCRRVGRLTRERAIGLLMAYTATLSRPAYDPDLGKVK